MISWVGPCHVKPEFMVDGEDLNAGSTIKGDQMLHFIVEKFNCSLLAAVGLQRILGQLSIDLIKKLSSQTKVTAHLLRAGDDIYFENKKLNISIATVSPNSALIHFAINVLNGGAPVPTLSLQELGLEAKTFSLQLMEVFSSEVHSMEKATQKVKWVP